LPFPNPLTDAQIVGRVEAATAKKLTITSEYGTFEIIS
jgi:phosphoribosylformylglycinamidine cyclo-ligase